MLLKLLLFREMKVLAVKDERDSERTELAFSFLKKWIDVRLDYWEAPCCYRTRTVVYRAIGMCTRTGGEQ